MNTEQEHELVSVIRDWLGETSGVDVPVGLSREEARRRAREVLAALTAGDHVPEPTERDGDFMDVLWASVEELDRKPPGQTTFEDCDRFYQLVAALSAENDPFDERDQILQRVAQIGWRSAPGAVKTILKSRAEVWEHGDADHHRRVCDGADRLHEETQVLGLRGSCSVSEIRDVCSRLLKLCSIRAPLVSFCVSEFEDLLASNRVGHLDDWEHSKGLASLVAGMAARLLCEWDDARLKLDAAAARFRRCAQQSDIERVRVERLSLEFHRGNFQRVCKAAPDLISVLTLPREIVKAQLIFGWALFHLGQFCRAREILELARAAPIIKCEPAIHACVLTILGNSLDHLDSDAEAMAAFKEAGAILTEFNHPPQLAYLAGAIGEFLSRRGKTQEAALLYEATREMYREAGHGRWVGYMGVWIAELLILRGETREAEKELRAAIPLLEKAGIWIESVAGVALLREAMAKRGTELAAIRDLRDQLRKQWQ